MNILDIIILICLIPAIIQGLKKGFISQVISIASIILGIWLSSQFANVVGEWIAKYISVSEQALKLISFAVILVGASLALSAIGKLIESLLGAIMLGWVNKILGLVFALAKTILILGLISMLFESVMTTFHITTPAAVADSALYPYLKSISDTVVPFIKSMLS
jgi:membrane protein required for colicin V production